MYRIQSWNARMLSYGGRLQLIKAVLLSIQVYWSQIILLPNAVIHEIEAICRMYLWSGASMSSKMALVAWNDVCRSKKEGGLDIRATQT